jgi:hypothetical protein
MYHEDLAAALVAAGDEGDLPHPHLPFHDQLPIGNRTEIAVQASGGSPIETWFPSLTSHEFGRCVRPRGSLLVGRG